MPVWVNLLRKEQLVELLKTLGIDHTGTLDKLRRRLRRIVIQIPTQFEPRVTPGYRMPPADGESPAAPVVPAAATEVGPTAPDPAKAMNQIRKWGCHFDGKNPMAFLERVEELRQVYGCTDGQLLLSLPELLRGDSLLWYRNCREAWTDWTGFCRDF
ncbi:hypothetical protein RF55_21865 [Lasius niger]|uniref:SAP domain-containing protein n=1 Tax=Lasius niger TaxID=67767 RepID=A0A0J7MQE4_LASNI|nr:hypothetical protein RF55_21865 [Lasius niger]